MTKPNNTEVAPMKLIIKSVILCACTFCIVQLECIMFDTSISFYQLSKYLYTKRPEFFQYHFSFLENISNYRHVLFLRVKKPCFDNPKNFGTQERILRLAKINLPCFTISWTLNVEKNRIKINKCSSGQLEKVNCRLF